jgi:hypothetical protein
MASLDSLPADQRAVLQLVLQRGRTYDDIAKLLSIDRTAVRQRALAALDALGPGGRAGLGAEPECPIRSSWSPTSQPLSPNRRLGS